MFAQGGSVGQQRVLGKVQFVGTCVSPLGSLMPLALPKRACSSSPDQRLVTFGLVLKAVVGQAACLTGEDTAGDIFRIYAASRDAQAVATAIVGALITGGACLQTRA